MRKLVVGSSVVLVLTGCFHDTIDDPVKQVIDRPTLSLQADFENTQNYTVATLDEVSGKQIIDDVLFRFMNIVEIANQNADQVAESIFSPPVKYKSRGKLIVQSADKKYCSSDDQSTKNSAEAFIWDDRDNSSNASEGDFWYYELTNCQSSANSSIVTGLIGQTGIYQEFLPDPIISDEFSGYVYQLDLEVDPQNGNIAYIKDAELVYSREIDGQNENEITTLKINEFSKFGVSSTANNETSLFLIEVKTAILINDEDASTLQLNLEATYYDSNSESFVEVSTPQTLTFSYTLFSTVQIGSENNPYESISLVSGILEISDTVQIARMMVNPTDETQVDYVFNSDMDTLDSIDQSFYFNTELNDEKTRQHSFSLINLSGG